MLFYFLLITASPFLITAIQQNSDDAVGTIQVVDKIFNTPVAYGQSIGEKRNVPPPPPCDCDKPFDECMKSCDIILIYDPVCGTDNITYINTSELNCAQCCGKDVTVNYPGNCTMCLYN